MEAPRPRAKNGTALAELLQTRLRLDGGRVEHKRPSKCANGRLTRSCPREGETKGALTRGLLSGGASGREGSACQGCGTGDVVVIERNTRGGAEVQGFPKS